MSDLRLDFASRWHRPLPPIPNPLTMVGDLGTQSDSTASANGVVMIDVEGGSPVDARFEGEFTMQRRLAFRTALAALTASTLALASGFMTGPVSAATSTTAGSTTNTSAFKLVTEPLAGLSPETGPSVLPKVTCVRRINQATKEAVFGYNGVDPLSNRPRINRIEISPGPQQPFAPVSNPPVVTQFQPGNHPNRFSIRFPASGRVRWVLEVPRVGEPDLVNSPDSWRLTITAKDSGCEAWVPRRFAVAQYALGGPADPVITATDDSGRPIEAHLPMIGTTQTACSAGGTPGPSQLLWGYQGEDANGFPGLLDPLTSVVRIDTFGPFTFARSYDQERILRWPTSDSWTGVSPILDAYATCEFQTASGPVTVVSRDALWGPEGTSQPPVFSWGLIKDEFGVWGLQASSVAPGGGKFR